MSAPVLPRLLRAQEVAEATGLELATVYALARAGRIPVVRVGTRNFRFSAAAVAKWIEDGGCSGGDS